MNGNILTVPVKKIKIFTIKYALKMYSVTLVRNHYKIPINKTIANNNTYIDSIFSIQIYIYEIIKIKYKIKWRDRIII